MARNPLSCGAKCSRITLICFNIIFLLLGIALFVLGLVFRFGSNTVKDELKPAFDNISVGDYKLYDIINSLAIIFIIIGAIIIGISFIGFVGAACYVKAALIIYAILVGLWLALELAGVIIFFIVRDKLESQVKDGMEKSVKEANNRKADYQKATEFMFVTYECCKVNNERLATPGTTSDICQPTKSTYMTDCYDSFTNWLKKYQAACVGVCIASMVVQLLLIILACWVCRAVSKKAQMV